MGNTNRRCSKCDAGLRPQYDVQRRTVHGQRVYVYNDGEYYSPLITLDPSTWTIWTLILGAFLPALTGISLFHYLLGLFFCARCFDRMFRDEEEVRREEEREKARRREEEREKARRREEEREKRRIEEEREKRRIEEEREKARRREEEREKARRREEEREKRRIEEEREKARRREEEREKARRREEEREKRRIEEEREKARRREEEREKRRIEEEREKARRREEEREKRRIEEEREKRRIEEEREKERQMMWIQIQRWAREEEERRIEEERERRRREEEREKARRREEEREKRRIEEERERRRREEEREKRRIEEERERRRIEEEREKARRREEEREKARRREEEREKARRREEEREKARRIEEEREKRRIEEEREKRRIEEEREKARRREEEREKRRIEEERERRRIEEEREKARRREEEREKRRIEEEREKRRREEEREKARRIEEQREKRRLEEEREKARRREEEREKARRREEEREKRRIEEEREKARRIEEEREKRRIEEEREKARRREEEREKRRREEEREKRRIEEEREKRRIEEEREKARRREEEREKRRIEEEREKARRIEEEREKRRIEEERERRRREELNQRLKESHQQAEEQHEKLSSNISEEFQQHVLIKHPDEFETNADSASDCDELVEILSLKCSVPLLNLSLTELTADQLGTVLSVLDKLLFDEWIGAPPSLSTLQHTQVFITELCVLSPERHDGLSLQNISNHVQSLMESISQSACHVTESFLLTQALYLNLMHFFTDCGSSDTDAVLIAKQWAEHKLSTEQLFLLEFLGTLTSSLQSAVERASVFILKMEVQCLKLLLSTLTHLNGNETHSESTEMLLRLVQTNQWTPMEALTLLKALSQKYAEDASITEVLKLVHLYDLSPKWTDESGLPLIQALESAGPERFHQDFQKTLRKKDESSLVAALAEMKTFWILDDSVTDMIKSVITAVLQYSENAPKGTPFMKDSFKCVTSNADNMQILLSQLCKAVFDTKGWWPTVTQMLRWCVLVLTESSGELQLVGVEEDPCVVAMFVAAQVCTGNKVDIVLSSDDKSEEQMKEWSDFYKHLGISLNTNMKRTDPSCRDVYEADVVLGTMDDFVSDYLKQGIEVMQTGNPQLRRGFIIEEQSLSSSHNLELSRLRDNDSLVFVADVLQSLMGKFNSEDMELKQRFIKALFRVLHTNLSNNTNIDTEAITMSRKLSEKPLSSHEVFVLTFLKNLLRVVTEETESEENRTSPAGRWCLEILFACVERFHASKEQTKELLQKVSNLGAQRLWSPAEALNLLGTLTDHHYDKDCISIMKILHLMETYQVSSKWTDESNQSLLQLLGSFKTKNLIKHLEKSLRDEKVKSIDTLVDEIRQMKDIDEETLSKSCSTVTHVTNLIKTGEIKKHTDVERAKKLSHSTNTEDLQELLAVLCNAVHLHKAERKWWPRANQMISWCLMASSDTGKLLEMGTGEGKSCVIAMFAALRALRGEKVDVVSSSSVLCQRDAEEWANFFKYFGLTADTNTNKSEDKDRKECYQKDVVYGTIETFAADHLRQIFEMNDVRPDRSYQCIIIDEVDSLLLDQGVQLTYLSSPMASMQHLNVILTMIWGHVSQYGFLSAGNQTFVHGPPASFFKAIFDSIDTEENEINDPMDILRIAEASNTVPKGFTEDICGRKEPLEKLKTMSQDTVVDVFEKMEDYVPYGFTVYTLDDKGLLCLRKCSSYSNQDVPELTFLVLEEGLCCSLYDSEEILIKPIAELISAKIQYTPCTNEADRISIPGFLKNLVEKKVSVWVQNAFLAKQLKEGQEYVIENDNVCPVDFRSTGIVELNKKWGDGLQQFVEIKHQIKLSTISTVTNYVSNISFFEKYQGNIYGTTGTLGDKTDLLFLQKLYPTLSACKIPTFNRRKLFEVQGVLKASAEEWKSEIKRAVMAQISTNSYRDGRAALVICESINKATEMYNELQGSIPGEIILYCRSDADSLSKIEKELLPGDVIVATNLAGRGTDIKVSHRVNNSGGLFVILSFLSDNTRVELQAFGRTARKGKPGSAQVIVSTEHLQQSLRTVSSLEEAKSTRERLAVEKINHMMNDVTELKLREDLFSEYLKTLQDIHKNTDEDEKRAVVAIMNEYWGIWLQTKSEEIDQLKRNELEKSLKDDLLLAKSQCQSQTSPCSSIYHYIKFGNVALSEKKWDISTRLFEKAMKLDESWAAIAFYSHAYCTIQQKSADYLTRAKDDLTKAQISLKYLSEESVLCLQFVKMSSTNSTKGDLTSLGKQLTNKCSMLSYFDKNISEAIQKLDEIKEKGRDAIVKKSTIFSLVSSADEEDLQVEAYNLYYKGLKYVFSVEEEPRFPWEALAVCFLGVAQIVGGALLIAFTYGTFAQVGMELIAEGISDCIYGIESMVTGEFSWKSWAINKAISICVSLIGFGVGKLIAKGFKGCKMSVQGFGKQLKLMPKFLSRQAKDGFKVVAKMQMKNVVKYTCKKMIEQTIFYGFGKAEEALLKEILNNIEKHVKERVVNNVKANVESKCLATSIDFIILSHIEDEKQLHELLEDKNRRNELLAIFTKLSNTAMQPFYANLGWQNQLSSSLFSVIDRAKQEAKGKAYAILTAIQAVHMGALIADAITAVLNLSTKFFSNFNEQLNTFKEQMSFSEKVKANELSASDSEKLKEFKQEIADSISALLAKTLTEVFHQKFSSHLVSYVQGKVHGVIGSYVRKGLKSDRTEDLLRAGQNNRYISYMPGDHKSRHEHAGESGQRSQAHAENIMDPQTAGTLLDIRVLAEETGTKVVILTPDSNGKLTNMQELSPTTKPASQTVTLIYTPKSSQHPDGHYDVLINNQRVSIVNEDQSCLFHALAQGLKPEARREEIALEAARLRSVEADALLRHPDQWEPFVKRKQWSDAIRGGDWFMLVGALRKRMKKIKENKEVLENEVGKVKVYKEMKKHTNQNRGIGQFINADHQPPVSCILEARKKNQNSKLAEAMLEVGTNSSPLDAKLIPDMHKSHGLGLPTVYVPKEIHHEFPSTKSPAFRQLLATTISKDDVVGSLKLTILGGMPRFRLNNTKNFKDFQNNQMSQTRLNTFENSFQQHSIKIVDSWFSSLQGKGVMTDKHRADVTTWIIKKGYNNQNDPHRNQVSNLL